MHPAAEGESPEHVRPTAGRVLEGRYRLDAPLGEGGLGVVWRAVQLRLGKPVAVKLMQPEHVSREALRARFEREARSLAALSHPNIVDVIDFGVDGDTPFLVMELLEGRSLDHAIQAGIAPARALAIARDVARALAHAHAQGIAHRDLKPANVFLQRIDDGSELVRVLDFGLAKFLGEDERAEGAQLTRQGMILGTPAYMAPEQATGGPADARADVYSFGVMLFELLTGRRPFAGEGAELVRQHLLVATPTIASVRPDLEVAPEVDALIARATAKSPSERFASARELVEALFAVPATAVRPRAGATVEVVGPALAHAATVAGEAPTQASGALGSGTPAHGGTGASGVAAASGTGAPTGAGQTALASTMPARPGIRSAPAGQPAPDSALPARAPGGVPVEVSWGTGTEPSGAGARPYASSLGAPAAGLQTSAPSSDRSAASPRSPALATAPPAGQVEVSAQRPARRRALATLVVLGVGALSGAAAVAVLALSSPPATAPPETSAPALPVAGATPAPAPPVAPAPIAAPSLTTRPTIPAPAATPPPQPPSAGAARDDTPSAPYFEPDPDPWAGPVPPMLAAIRARLEGGATRLSAREVRALRNYVGRHPDDPRGWILMGHGEYLTGARTNACQRFERALQADVPLTRGDAWVVHDLARMAAHQAVGDHAAELLRRHWGIRAVPALDAAMVEVRRNGTPREDVERLIRLRDRIRRGAIHHP